MKKNEDLKKFSKTELRQKIKNLQIKENQRGDLGKVTAAISLCFGVISALALAEFMIPCAVCIGAASLGIITGWGIYASSIGCSNKIEEIRKEINSRPKEEYTQLAMDTFLKETKVKKNKKVATKSVENINEDGYNL